MELLLEGMGLKNTRVLIVGMGGPLGKTKKITQHGIDDVATRWSLFFNPRSCRVA